jgi:hypothetical protein
LSRIKNVRPGIDMGRHSGFQRELQSLSLPEHVRVLVFLGAREASRTAWLGPGAGAHGLAGAGRNGSTRAGPPDAPWRYGAPPTRSGAAAVEGRPSQARTEGHPPPRRRRRRAGASGGPC